MEPSDEKGEAVVMPQLVELVASAHTGLAACRSFFQAFTTGEALGKILYDFMFMYKFMAGRSQDKSQRVGRVTRITYLRAKMSHD